MSTYVIIFMSGLVIGLGFALYAVLQSKWKIEEITDKYKEQRRRDSKYIQDLEDELDILRGNELSSFEYADGYLV